MVASNNPPYTATGGCLLGEDQRWNLRDTRSESRGQ